MADSLSETRYTRRGFLGRVGLGVGAVALGPTGMGMTQSARAAAVRAAIARQTFGRMFPNLTAFADPTDEVKTALQLVGKPGGIMDAGDNLAAGPVELITDPKLSANNPNNPTQTAGTTFMGQFMDHDITFDATSVLGVPTQPERSPNARTPAFDLDSVYGGGPTVSPQLYDAHDRAKLKIGSGGRFEDLPRDTAGHAIIADPRNDENLIIAGLHCAVILFHNRMVDRFRDERHGNDWGDAYEEARRQTRWHYQWLIVHEFLPLFVGQAMVDDVLRNGRRFYRPRVGQAVMPVEFQGACYRFGHSIIRPSYRANLAGNPDRSPFFGMIFDPSQEGASDPADLRGGARSPRRFIGWQTFFDFGDGEVKPNKIIDTRISTPLFNLPLAAIATGDPPTVLPQRNLLRHLTWSLPSGQTVARAIGIEPLSRSDLADIGAYGSSLDTSTPLWFYVLREAHVRAGGLTLGPLGGRIVSEVIIGLLQTDPHSYLFQRGWRPNVPAHGPHFRMTDFLAFARVDPTSRGQ